MFFPFIISSTLNAGNLHGKIEAVLLFPFPPEFILHIFATGLFETVTALRDCWLWIEVAQTLKTKLLERVKLETSSAAAHIEQPRL